MIQNLCRHKLIMSDRTEAKGTKKNEHRSPRIRIQQIFLAFILLLVLPPVLFAEGQPGKNEIPATQSSEEGAWTGIDVSIVGKYASKYGRPPRDPYINTDQGDLLLFVFTLAGVIGGFVIGFNVRKLFYEK